MENTPKDSSKDGSALHKWAWFVALWLGGVLTVGAVSFLLRAVLLP